MARTRAELQELADSVKGRWWHSIDLGQGVVTEGAKSPAVLAAELEILRLPDLSGKTVLDIGAWDGFFSFAAERLGAKRVVALDHYVWSMDLLAQLHYVTECRARNEVPRPFETVPEVWRPDELPGKAGFDAARAALGSRVEAVVGDFTTVDLDRLGTFDVVLFLGVLYHMQHPLAALQRLCQLTGELAVVETEAVAVAGLEHHGLCEFFAGDELGGDATNWWVPNLKALIGLCRAAGFRQVELAGVRTVVEPTEDPVQRYRAVVHARK